MVGCVKYGLDCWMMDVEGKCSADAVARGLPVCTEAGERKGCENRPLDKEDMVVGRRVEDRKGEANGRKHCVRHKMPQLSKLKKKKKNQCDKRKETGRLVPEGQLLASINTV